MWIRTIKATFANELMKKSVRSYFSDNIDASLGQLVSYSVDLAENVVLVTHIFPDKDTLDAFEKTMKPQRDQLKSMGAKVEINDGPVWSFKVAGDITLDTLTKGVSPRQRLSIAERKKSQGINIEREQEMKMVLTSEVENVDNWLANRLERHPTILQFAENIVEYANA